jgi:hypothetical protein
MLSKKLSALVALSLVTASSAAGAQSAQSLSLANAPSTQTASGRTSALENRGNGYGVYIVGALVIAAIVYGIIKLTDKNNNPSSP